MVIAHLYYDLLNLYGNDGNIKILENKLKQIGIEVKIENLSVGDDMDFSKYDLVYIGSGIEENIQIAINDLKRYKEDIKNAIDNNKLFLITGNSIDIFGKYLEKDEKQDGLGLFEYNSKYVSRIKKDVIYYTDFLENPILGYENHNYILENNEFPLFENQGIKYKNFYGCYVEGPILVRNPELLKYFIKELVSDENKVEKLNLELEEKAYDNFRILLKDLDK